MKTGFLAQPSEEQRQTMIKLAHEYGYCVAEIDFEKSWKNIPVADCKNHAGKFWEERHKDSVRKGSRIFFSSGGSTGQPKYTLLNFSEVEQNSAIHGKGYRACGVLPSDVVATWGTPGIMSSEFTVYLALSHTGACILPIGDTSDPKSIIEIIRNFNASVLLVMPSDLSPIIALIEASGERLDNVRLIITGGEPLYEADEQRFRSFFSPKIVFRSVFQTSDTGTIGYQCPCCERGEYHVHDSLQILEIDNQDEQGVGDLVTTNLGRKLVPIVRVKTGDRVFEIPEKCACGISSPRIRFLGRSGRICKVGGEKFDLNRLNEIKEALTLPVDDFQITLSREEGLDQFKLLSNRVVQDSSLQEQAKNIFDNISQKLSTQLSRGVIRPLKFLALDRTNVVLSPSGKFVSFRDTRGI